ncbi:DNA polymerase III PolC-type [Kurthia zopfii]|uniref:DNA polymerase III PolC-type n=1 Tax=Kurthia zopfii TaxID=1650 RepID=A0A8B4Q6Z5_9BACL|nr:PolC-type DNA polymerase III [Kurthia zopfii]PWI22766.1 PolC-type DNA polymerase III [Kurthia zopfii]TDR41807.1 DNA polymerase-3 subunit alpha (Gram-positive type) [Kurthia zopfii]GEK30963.1 DNA polymerase III PolC-type [Kurthia zopfii]STX09118.1 DNA polymerase III polC-type [Kurthia zopfii]
MSEEMTAKQRFKILLQQIALTDDVAMQYLENGELNRLTVQKANRVWQFALELDRILPYNHFLQFQNHVDRAFSQIATIQLQITTKNSIADEKLIHEYWMKVVEEQDELSPPLRQILSQQLPKVVGQKLMINCNQDFEQATLRNKYADRLSETFQSYGFDKLHFDFQVKDATQEMAEEQQKFMAQRRIEEEAISKKAVEDMQKREKERQNNPEGIDVSNQPFQLGLPIKNDEGMMEIHQIQDEERRIIIEGFVFDAEVKELRSGRSLMTLKVSDYTDSILVKMFSRDKEDAALMQLAKKGMWVKVRGSVQNDTFVRDLIIMAQDIVEIRPIIRKDEAPEGEKRVELHMHTPMSSMDAVTPTGELVAAAAKWGHPAIAITDHAVAQSFPDAHNAGKKHGIKIIYGVEINLVDDGVPIAYDERHIKLDDATYVVFDVETTGLSAAYDTIIELAAVKIVNGEVIDTFESFSNPHHALSATTIELTGITDDMVKDAPEVTEMITKFHDFIGDGILVAHNASFDIGFLYEAYKKANIDDFHQPVIDTLELARLLHPTMKNHRLNSLCKKFNIELTQHHRAIYDTEATGYLLLHLMKEATAKGIEYHDDFNKYVGGGDAYKRARPTHCTVLAQTNDGLKNMFKMLSESFTQSFFRMPRIKRSTLQKYREGLIVGSGCSKGEFFTAVMQKSMDEALEIAKFYDYLEVHPPAVYAPLVESELIKDEWNMQDIIRKVIKIGKKLEKPVIATGNVHYLHEEDAIFRKILIRSQGGANPLNRNKLPDVHFRTTNEMLDEFAFLGEDLAKEIVVTNSQNLAKEMEEVVPVKDDLYTPKIDGADEEVRRMTYEMAHDIYGEELPEIVEKRIDKELKSIIGHGFSVIYLISHKLVKKSLSDGYLVGSRGSVGSSLVATFMEITEVNPLPPHYVCPNCQKSEFFDDGSVGSGFDLPNKDCPDCEIPYAKDGHDIPFETFLGFKGDKVPDIDLNFSGEYQPQAHNYTKILFGEDYAFRAGTIGTVAEKTAYGYVKGYGADHDINFRGAEVDRLVQGCTGVKRTTGQHPGGIIVVPNYMDVFDFTPIQFPADDQGAEWRTTHFDFHSIHDNILKLDILGHDDPTVIRMLLDLTGIDPKTIPTDDPEVMAIFSGPESLGVTAEQIKAKSGTYGIPEFGTKFVRGMLEDTKPSTFSELVQISGLSHGTDVWLGNASELIQNGTCVLSEVIGCRDDIMVYLIYQELEPSLAFKIMEHVRKGKGLTEDMEEEMRKNEVPEWYIDSCKKIKYMFPKAHAAAYVLMAVRIAYFKVHFPIVYYCAYFTVRASDFDLIAMVNGSEMIKSKIEEIEVKGLEASVKERSLQTVLEISLEMTERGMQMQKVDLYRSKATEFIIDGASLIPPFNAIPGLGNNVAEAIVRARADGEFLSKEDLQLRGRVSKTLIEYMDKLGCLTGMPDANQLSLF